MATETRVIRPYEGTATFQDVLERWRFRVGEDDVESGTVVALGPDEFTIEPELRFDGDDDEYEAARDDLRTGLAALDLVSGDVDFVVLTTSPRLKLSDVVLLQNLDQEVPRLVEIGRGSSRALRTPYGGCVVEVALCLGRDIEAHPEHPLRPTRKGTWLARTNLVLRPAPERAGFPVFALNDEVRERLGLSPEVVRYARLTASPAEPADPDSLEVYLDEDLYGRITAQPRAVGAKALQRELWMTAMIAIVVESLRLETLRDLDLDELEDSWLGRLLFWIAGSKKSDRRAWLNAMLDDPAMFLAQVDVLAQQVVEWKEIV